MAITLVGQASNSASTGAAISVTHGLTIAENDVIIALVNLNGSGSRTLSDNNGGSTFTQDLVEGGSSPTRVYQVWSRVASASEPSSYNFTASTSDRWSIILIVQRGVNTSSIYDVAPSIDSFRGSSGNPWSANSIITSNDNSLAIAWWFADLTSGTASAPTDGYGDLITIGANMVSASTSKLITPAGATGTTEVTNTSSSSYGSIHFALNKESSAPVLSDPFSAPYLPALGAFVTLTVDYANLHPDSFLNQPEFSSIVIGDQVDYPPTVMPSGNALSIASNGQFTVTNGAALTVDQTFDYALIDASTAYSRSNVSTVTIIIVTAPSFNTAIPDQSGVSGTTVNLDVSGLVDNSPTSYSLNSVGTDAGLSISNAGVITGTLPTAQTVSGIIVTATNSAGQDSSAPFNWVVSAGSFSLVAAAAGSSTSNADIAITKSLVGVSAGSSTSNADIAITKSLVGVSAGSSTSNADLAITKSLVAAAAGSSTSNADLAITKSLVADTAGSSTANADLVITKNLSGVAAGSSTANADVSVAGAFPLVGVAAGSSTATADVVITKSLAGVAAGSSTADATLTLQFPLSGVTAGSSTATADVSLAGAFSLVGVAAGSSTATADVAITKSLAGVAAGSSTANADIGVSKTLVAVAAGSSTATADVVISKSLAGVAAGTSTATADVSLAGAFSLRGTSNGSSTTTATIAIDGPLAGVAAGSSTANANLTVAGSFSLAGTTAGSSTASADVNISKPLVGTAAGSSTASASMSITKNLAGSANGSSTLAGRLGFNYTLIGEANGTSTATGRLTSPTSILLGAQNLTIRTARDDFTVLKVNQNTFTV